MSRHWRLRSRAGSAVRLVRIEVQPHPAGPWIVRAGARTLAVPPEAGHRLLSLHGARLDAGPAAPASCRRAPAWQVTVIPAAAVRAASGALAPLASTAGLAFLGAGGLATAACLRPWSGAGGLSGPALLMFTAAALAHELGHAAALRREGYLPGRIGLGLLVVVPVLFADVSAVHLLGRGGRVRVDLAGAAFQSAVAGLLAVVAAVGDGALAGAAAAAAVATLATMAWSLLPLPRSDGGWALRDALGEPAGRAAVPALTALAAMQVALAALACALAPARVAGLLAAVAAGAGLPLSPGLEAGLRAVLQAAALAWGVGAALRAVRGLRARRRARARAGGPA